LWGYTLDIAASIISQETQRVLETIDGPTLEQRWQAAQ